MKSMGQKYIILEILPQAKVAVATLCQPDQSVLCEFASECCPDCAIQGCLRFAALEDMIEDQEAISIRHIDPNQDDE